MTATPDAMRDLIREVVRDVIREVIAEELAAAMASMPRATAASTSNRPAVSTMPAKSAPVDGVLRRGALTERHVRAAGSSGRITITRAVVVTPLAKERAKAMGVEIIRIEE